MPNPNYVKGARQENAVRKILESQGYSVMRSAGSKGVFDLIAWNAEEVRFIQVKYDAPIQPDLDKMSRVEVPPNGTKELWHRKRYEREWQITLNTSILRRSIENAKI